MTRRLALALLVVGLVATYAWQWVPAEQAGSVFAMTSHWYAAVLLLVLGLVLQDVRLWWVLGYLVVCSLMVVGCNAWWLAAPWPAMPGDELCSTRLKWPLGAIGLVLFVVLAGGVYMDRKRGRDDGS